MDPKPLNRQQLAKICGNDPEAIRLMERLFVVSGQQTPNAIEEGFEGDDILGQVFALRSEVQDYAELAQRAIEIVEASNLAGRDDPGAMDYIAPAAKESRRHCYGQFYDTTTQVVTAINTAQVVAINTTNLAAGVWVDANQIRVAEAGLYDFQVSVSLDKTAGGTGHFYLWFRKNEVDIPGSAIGVRVQGNDAEVFTSRNLFIPMGPTENVQLMWSASTLDVELKAFPAVAPVPLIPSIAITVSNNIEGDQ